jgi:hypothetical protein
MKNFDFILILTSTIGSGNMPNLDVFKKIKLFFFRKLKIYFFNHKKY